MCLRWHRASRRKIKHTRRCTVVISEYNIGYRGFIFNAFKTVGLLGIYSLGCLIGDRVWKIIRPLNSLYQQRGTL